MTTVQRYTAETQCCPNCGRPLEAVDAPVYITALGEIHYRGIVTKLCPTEMDFFALLHEAYPRDVSRASLMADLYPDADQDDAILSVWLSRIRRLFKRSGAKITIVSRGGNGARRSYALVWGDSVNHD